MPALKDNDPKVKYIMRNFDHYRGFLPRRHISKPFNSSAQTDRFQVQGSKFKGYNRLKLLKILIKIRNVCHNLLGGTVLKPRWSQYHIDASCV